MTHTVPLTLAAGCSKNHFLLQLHWDLMLSRHAACACVCMFVCVYTLCSFYLVSVYTNLPYKGRNAGVATINRMWSEMKCIAMQWWKCTASVWRCCEHLAIVSTRCIPWHAGDVSHFTLSGLVPTVSKKTHVIIPLVEELQDDRWEAAIVKQDDRRIMVSVNSSPTAVIGRYQLIVETYSTNGQAVSTHDPANDIYMLFNPWCEGIRTPDNKISYSPADIWGNACVKWVHTTLWSFFEAVVFRDITGNVLFILEVMINW